MARAGWPPGSLTAFLHFMERLDVFISFGQGLGLPRRRPRSIPQGCPLSTAMLSLCTAPWQALVEASPQSATGR
eukprot:14569024-Alexandrium_andersonii.AAC.1